jgi:hypothetical protein
VVIFDLAATGTVRSSLYNSAGTRVANKTGNTSCAIGEVKIPFDSTYAAAPGHYYISVTFSTAHNTSMASAFKGSNPAGAGAGATAASITPASPGVMATIPIMSTY